MTENDRMNRQQRWSFVYLLIFFCLELSKGATYEEKGRRKMQSYQLQVQVTFTIGNSLNYVLINLYNKDSLQY